MISTRTIGRLAAAAVLVATTTVVAFGSPAGAQDPTTTTEAPTTTLAPEVYPTGSLVNNGDGTVTLTYAHVTEQHNVYVIFAPVNTTCAVDPQTMLTAQTLFLATSPEYSNITASPMLIQAGTAAWSFPGLPTAEGPVESTLPAGSYQTCLYGDTAQDFGLLSSAAMEVGAVPAPAPAPAPVVPAYTG